MCPVHEALWPCLATHATHAVCLAGLVRDGRFCVPLHSVLTNPSYQPRQAHCVGGVGGHARPRCLTRGAYSRVLRSQTQRQPPRLLGLGVGAADVRGGKSVVFGVSHCMCTAEILLSPPSRDTSGATHEVRLRARSGVRFLSCVR
jgi:hypothetical protein